jgi:predicted PurR-regulated permease PerM
MTSTLRSVPDQTPTTEPHSHLRLALSDPGPASLTRVTLQVLLVIVGVAFGLWALHRLAAVVLVMILAVVLAYLIAPFVELAERPVRIGGHTRRLSRGLAVALVYVLMAGAVAGGSLLLLPSVTRQVDDMAAQAPTYARSMVAWEHGWSRYYDRLRIPVEVRDRLGGVVVTASDAVVESARLSLMTVASDLPWLMLVPIVAFFLLRDAAVFRRTIVIALPHRVRLRGHRLFEEVNATLAACIRAQLLACVLVGTLCGLGFAALGIPYPVLLGVLAGLLEFIPLFGPLLLLVVAAIVAALQAPALVLRVIGFLGVLRLIEDYGIYPRLIRRGLNLHPLAVIVAVLAGAELDGVAGMFLAVPIVAVATVVCRHWLEWRRGESEAAAALHASV